jgi:NCS2 family nucleobase:cation symporter-2
MCLVMVVVMVESLGMFFAVGEMVGRPMDRKAITRGLRGDAVGAILGGVFNTFPYTSFSQNVGLVGVTGVRSRYVCVAGGIIMLLLGLSPKLAALVAAAPVFVLGGAGLVMFGMVVASGVRVLSTVDYAGNRNNLFVVAISVGVGLIPLVADKFFQFMPPPLAPVLHSGVLLATLAAVGLNLYFNGLGTGPVRVAAEAAH